MITVFMPTMGHVLYFSFVKLTESFPFGCRNVFNVVSGSPSLSRCNVSRLIVVTTLKINSHALPHLTLSAVSRLPARSLGSNGKSSFTNLKNSFPIVFIPRLAIISLHDNIWSEIVPSILSIWNFSVDFIKRITTEYIVRVPILKSSPVQIRNRVRCQPPVGCVICSAWSAMWFETFHGFQTDAHPPTIKA